LKVGLYTIAIGKSLFLVTIQVVVNLLLSRLPDNLNAVFGSQITGFLSKVPLRGIYIWTHPVIATLKWLKKKNDALIYSVLSFVSCYQEAP
jgi:hypothetical protein